MRALVWHGPRKMTVEHLPEPVPGPGDVLVRVGSAGICGSELSGYLGESSIRKPPLVMGHEFSGRVERAAGGGRLKTGQPVVINPLLSCGGCRLCRMGRHNLCPTRAIIGAHRPGAFADLVAVPERSCHLVPDGLDPVLAAMTEPLGCGVRAVEIAAIGRDDSVLILGAGTIGLCSLAVARRTGARVLAVTDLNEARLRTARAWGATHAFGPATDIAAEARELSGGLGVDVAIDAVGATATRLAAVRSVRPGGRVVLVGLHEAESPLPANDMVRGETEVVGSFAYRPVEFERALGLLSEGLIPRPGPWMETRSLDAGPAAFDELLAGRVAASKIMLRP